jgi:hypothetical protein
VALPWHVSHCSLPRILGLVDSAAEADLQRVTLAIGSNNPLRENTPTRCAGMGCYTHAGQRSRCSYAYAVAAAREETSNFAKMFETCRSTVFFATTRSAAIPWFVLPVASSRST